MSARAYAITATCTLRGGGGGGDKGESFSPTCNAGCPGDI